VLVADERAHLGERVERVAERMAAASAASRSTNSSKIGRSTYTRSVPRHTCPVLANAERTVPATASERSASANTMPGFLPPISSETHARPSRGGHDRLAGAGLAGEGDPVDVGVRGEELAGGAGPEPVHDVVDAGGDADGVHHLAEQGGRGGRLLRGLHDHGVAAGERRADLPRHQQQRQVPRTDHRDDALRAAQP
jgi:hypothetical protein